MYKFLTRFLLNVLILLIISELLSGVLVDNLFYATIAVVVISVLNTFIRPVLHILFLPVTIITLGFFSFVINALLFWLAATLLDGFAVQSFWFALLGSLLFSVMTAVANRFIS